MATKNYIGMRFGTRVCIDQVKVPRQGTRLTLKCDCGRESSSYLSMARSSGCIACVQVKHGYSRGRNQSPEYRTWLSMWQRCTCPNVQRFPQYGGRGITVCDEWKKFEAFLADMGDRPEGTSLDRINNDLGYCKSNCRWATDQQQRRNKRNNVIVTINGQSRCLAEWSEISGISYQLLKHRIRAGWPEDRLLSPAAPRKPFQRKEV